MMHVELQFSDGENFIQFTSGKSSDFEPNGTVWDIDTIGSTNLELKDLPEVLRTALIPESNKKEMEELKNALIQWATANNYRPISTSHVNFP